MQLHSTYVQRRQLGTTYREFQRLWRSHGDFAASVPAFWSNVDRYVHNDPVEEPSGLPAIVTDYDAVGELYYTSIERWAAMRKVMWNEVAPDEKRVFAGPPIAVRGTRRVIRPPNGQYKLFTLTKRRREYCQTNVDEVLQRYVDYVDSLPTFTTALKGFTITTANQHSDALGMDTVPQTASTHEVLCIYHFETEASARAALISFDYIKLLSFEGEFMEWDSRVSLLCRAWSLKGDEG